MKTFLSRDQPPFLVQSWDIFPRLAAIFEIHCGIRYECSFAEPLTLLGGTHFENHFCDLNDRADFVCHVLD